MGDKDIFQTDIFQVKPDNFNEINYGLVFCDHDGKIIHCNKSFLNLHGYKKNELEGKNFSILYKQDQQDFVDAFIEQTKVTGSFQGINYHKTKENKLIPVLVNTTLIEDSPDKKIVIGLMINNLTEILEQKIQQLKQFQERSLWKRREWEQYSRKIIHDIKSPVSMISLAINTVLLPEVADTDQKITLQNVLIQLAGIEKKINSILKSIKKLPAEAD